MTTYDFIVSEQKKQREKKQAKLTAKSKKKSAKKKQETETSNEQKVSPTKPAVDSGRRKDESIIINRGDIELSNDVGQQSEGYQEVPSANEEAKDTNGSRVDSEKKQMVVFDQNCENCEIGEEGETLV